MALATWRASDRWIAIGLIAFIYVGGRVLQWQISENERLYIQAQEYEKKTQVLRQTRKPREREKTEDDVTIDDLIILTQSPDWETRHAAIDILLNRFASRRDCRLDLQNRLNSAELDVDERATSQHLAQWAAEAYGLDLSLAQRDFDFRERASSLSPDEEATDEDAWEPSSPLFQPGFQIDGDTAFADMGAAPDPEGATTSRLDGVDEDTRAWQARSLFHELPMGIEDEVVPRLYASASADSIRQRRREAMVLGTDRDGMQVFERGELSQSIEGISPRTLGDRVEEMGRQVDELNRMWRSMTPNDSSDLQHGMLGWRDLDEISRTGDALGDEPDDQ